MGESEYIMVEKPGFVGMPPDQVPPAYRNAGKSHNVLAPPMYGPTASSWLGNIIGAKSVFEQNAADVARLGALAAQATEIASGDHATPPVQPETVIAQGQNAAAEGTK